MSIFKKKIIKRENDLSLIKFLKINATNFALISELMHTSNLEIVLHWLSSLTLKDNQVDLTDPLTFKFLNEITSFFSNVIFPEIKERTMSKWENHSDPQLFFGDLRAKILNLVELRLENIIFKKLIKNKSNVAEKT